MAQKNAGFLGCGTVFLAPYVNGAPSNHFYDLDECDKFEIKENVSEKERKSGRCDTYGQLKSQVKIKEPSDLTIGFSTMNKDNFAMLFLADAVDTVIAAGSFTKTINVRSGKIVRMPMQNVATLSVTTTDSATTYVDGTDYKIINAGMGLVSILDTGSIVDGDVVFEGTTGAVNKVKMVGGSAYDKRFSVMLVGTNLDTGLKHSCIVHDVRLTPQSGVDFMADDFLNGELTGKPVVDPATGETYVVETDYVFA